MCITTKPEQRLPRYQSSQSSSSAAACFFTTAFFATGAGAGAALLMGDSSQSSPVQTITHSISRQNSRRLTTLVDWWGASVRKWQEERTQSSPAEMAAAARLGAGAGDDTALPHTAAQDTVSTGQSNTQQQPLVRREEVMLKDAALRGSEVRMSGEAQTETHRCRVCRFCSNSASVIRPAASIPRSCSCSPPPQPLCGFRV